MSIFETKWKNEAFEQIKMARPDLPDKKIWKYLDKVYEKHENPPCVLDNNYRHKTIKTSLLALYDWIYTTKPIVGGYGVFYQNQNKAVNNIARMISKFLATRKVLKNKMKASLDDNPDPDTNYEYKHYDMLQAGEKVCANAIYGSGGAKVSFSYNLYTAASTTGTAQSLISTACAAFEMFMTNSCKFYDLDEMISFIMNVLHEKRKLSLDGIAMRTREELKQKLLNTCFHPRKINQKILDAILDRLTGEDITRLYYKNNLFEFTMNCQEVMYRLRKIMRETKSFRAPGMENKPGNEKLKKDLNKIWKYYSEFVHYKHPVYNRIYRLKTSERKSVLVIDTDSNMILIHNWIELIQNYFVDDDNQNSDEDNMYIAASMIGVFVTNMIQDTLDQYCYNANVLKEYWKNINMKNEFFFEKLITTEVKKHYMSSVLLREGKSLGGKLDVKGLNFVKSIMSEDIGNYYKAIIKENIMGDKIEFATILKKLNQLSTTIRESLQKGEIRWCKPMAVKDFNKYKDPLSEMGIRAVMAHNFAVPEKPIELPENVMVIKVKMEKLSDIEPLKEIRPDVYQRLVNQVYNNANKRISKGINSFAVEQTDEKMPDWLIPFVNFNTIIEDAMKSFYPVLKSLSLEIINTRSTNLMYSNLIRL